jgi:3-dehydroquinate synthase
LNTENPLLHGEAIAAGILLESFLSAHYGSLSNAELDDISSTLNSYYTLPQLSRETQEAVVLLMRHDKKNHKDAVNFVALAEIGEAKYDITYTDEALQEAFDYYNTLTYR